MTKSESPVLARVEWVAAIAITALVVLAHVELRRHVGPLWRDEAATVNVATMPSPHELWASLEFDLGRRSVAAGRAGSTVPKTSIFTRSWDGAANPEACSPARDGSSEMRRATHGFRPIETEWGVSRATRPSEPYGE